MGMLRRPPVMLVFAPSRLKTLNEVSLKQHNKCEVIASKVNGYTQRDSRCGWIASYGTHPVNGQRSNLRAAKNAPEREVDFASEREVDFAAPNEMEAGRPEKMMSTMSAVEHRSGAGLRSCPNIRACAC